jgi:signal transduction histidine kinase
VLAIQDEGGGIHPEVMKKLGIPFVTTKENGTGLGLAICYSIVQRHRAKMDVESGPFGTTFYIRYNRTA